jgi:hypothetical protein
MRAVRAASRQGKWGVDAIKTPIDAAANAAPAGPV